MRQAVAATTGHHIPRVCIKSLSQLHCMPAVLRPLDFDVTSRSREDRFDVPDVEFLRRTLAAKRVDEYLDPLAPLSRAVYTVEEMR